MRRFTAPAALIAAVFISGCATLFAGGRDDIRLESSPSGAEVVTENGLVLGTTPLMTALKPDDYFLTFRLDGYEPSVYSLGKKVDGVAFLNLLCVLCWGIDFATGALWGLEDEYVRVELRPTQTGAVREEELNLLACSNYAALDATARSGRLSPEQLNRGRELVLAATAVPKGDCMSADGTTAVD